MKRTASWSLANQTWAEVSMRGWPCSPNHQKERAPKTAMVLFGAARGAVGLEDVGPDDGVAVEDGGAVGRRSRRWVRRGAEAGEAGFPGGVEVVGGEAAVEGGLVDLAAQGAEVVQGGVAGLGFGGGQDDFSGVVHARFG